MALKTIISGGQTGVDQAAWRAAKASGLESGGYMPRGFKTEAGPRSDFAKMYRAIEHSSAEYRPRTEANVVLADTTLWLGETGSPGFWATSKSVQKHKKIMLTGDMESNENSRAYARFLVGKAVCTLNVAGNRESTNRGIGHKAEGWLMLIFAEVRRLENLS